MVVKNATQKTTGAHGQKNRSSQRIFHIFSVVLLFKDILVGG